MSVRTLNTELDQFPVALAFGACVLLLDQLIVLLEEDPVAHFVILPNFEEDGTVLRDNLENLGCSPSAEKHMRMVSLGNLGRSRSAEKHMRIVSAMDRLVAATGHPLRGHDGKLSSAVLQCRHVRVCV